MIWENMMVVFELCMRAFVCVREIVCEMGECGFTRKRGFGALDELQTRSPWASKWISVSAVTRSSFVLLGMAWT